MATYSEMIAKYEAARRDAERRMADANRMAEKYLQALEAAGMETMTDE
jgi:hypothetical protein